MTLMYYFANLSKNDKVVLPVGVKKCKVRTSGKNVSILEMGYVTSKTFGELTNYEFPIINGKSPCQFTFASETGSLQFMISELGGIPDPNYFEGTPTVIPEIIPDDLTEQEEKKDAI